MLTPADTDSQISSEHVTVSNFQDSANLFICIAIWICPKVGYSQINWFRVCPIFTQTHLHIVPWHVLSPHAGDRPDWADAQVASFAFETGLSRLPLKLCSKCGKLQRRGLCLGPLGPLGPLGSGGAWTKTTKTNMAGKSSNWMIKFRWEHHRTSKKMMDSCLITKGYNKTCIQEIYPNWPEGTRRSFSRLHLQDSAGLFETKITLWSAWWFQPLRKILVSWDDYSRYMEK